MCCAMKLERKLLKRGKELKEDLSKSQHARQILRAFKKLIKIKPINALE